MELLEIELTSFERRARTTVVAHGGTSLTRGLEPGEPVLLRDADGTCWSAFVSDLDFDLDDTRYRFTLVEPLAHADAGVGRVEALLHQARTTGVADARRLRQVR